MGKKIGGVYYILCVVAVVLQAVSIELPWHSLAFKTVLVTAMRLQTGLLSLKADKKMSMACKLPLINDACKSLEDGTSLHDASLAWCVPAIATVYPQPCIAYTDAFYFGIIVVAVLAFNFVALSVAGYFLWSYHDSPRPKAQYREVALWLHVGFTIALVVSVALYSAMVISKLDNMAGTGIYIMAQASYGSGISYGYFMIWIGIFFQLAAGVLLFYVDVGDEQTADERAAHKFEKAIALEAQNYGTAQMGQGYGQASSYHPTPMFLPPAQHGPAQQLAMPEQGAAPNPWSAQPVAAGPPGTPLNPAW